MMRYDYTILESICVWILLSSLLASLHRTASNTCERDASVSGVASVTVIVPPVQTEI